MTVTMPIDNLPRYSETQEATLDLDEHFQIDEKIQDLNNLSNFAVHRTENMWGVGKRILSLGRCAGSLVKQWFFGDLCVLATRKSSHKLRVCAYSVHSGEIKWKEKLSLPSKKSRVQIDVFGSIASVLVHDEKNPRLCVLDGFTGHIKDEVLLPDEFIDVADVSVRKLDQELALLPRMGSSIWIRRYGSSKDWVSIDERCDTEGFTFPMTTLGNKILWQRGIMETVCLFMIAVQANVCSEKKFRR